MKYLVEVSPQARKQLKTDTQIGSKKDPKIASLADDPRPFGYKKLFYYTDFFRVRVGNYRVIYTVEDQQLLVIVVEVSDRRDAY